MEMERKKERDRRNRGDREKNVFTLWWTSRRADRDKKKKKKSLKCRH